MESMKDIKNVRFYLHPKLTNVNILAYLQNITSPSTAEAHTIMNLMRILSMLYIFTENINIVENSIDFVVLKKIST